MLDAFALFGALQMSVRLIVAFRSRDFNPDWVSGRRSNDGTQGGEKPSLPLLSDLFQDYFEIQAKLASYYSAATLMKPSSQALLRMASNEERAEFVSNLQSTFLSNEFMQSLMR